MGRIESAVVDICTVKLAYSVTKMPISVSCCVWMALKITADPSLKESLSLLKTRK
jgi:hypothetical protein